VKVRNVTGQMVVVPVDGGIAVGVDAVVDVSDDVGVGLVSSGQFGKVSAAPGKRVAPTHPKATAKRAKK
jgi:hypothetical protein